MSFLSILDFMTLTRTLLMAIQSLFTSIAQMQSIDFTMPLTIGVTTLATQRLATSSMQANKLAFLVGLTALHANQRLNVSPATPPFDN